MVKSFTKYDVLTVLFLLPSYYLGQENLLFTNDQYSGINAAVVSPTQAFLNPNPWDVNLFAEDIFFNNDYAYISDQSFFGLSNSKIQALDLKNNITGENTPSVLDFYNNAAGNYHFSSDVLGPSFSLKTKIKDKEFTVGLFSRLRTQSSAIDVDNYLRFSNQSEAEPTSYLLQPLQLNLMNWGEIGINVATKIFPYSNYEWVIGVNFKYEIGFDSVNINSKSPLKLTRFSEEIENEEVKTIFASNYNLETNFATNYNFETDQYEAKQRGKGFGLDFGLAFIDRYEDSENYNLRMSFNILDLGRVNFKGENHFFQGNVLKIVNNPNLEDVEFESPTQYLQLLSQEVYGDKNASLQGIDFQIGLPTSVHFNLSKNVGGNQYINADFIQRTPVFENSLKRSNVFQTSYSVQKPILGYGASISLYEYRSLQFGGYLRIGPLILGSTNLFPLVFKQKRLNSGDFYIAIKIFPFWDNAMKRHRRADCYCD